MPRSAPSGTITLLFTDIEGSTRLWQDHPGGMAAVLERHDSLLRDALQSHDGYVFKTVGDAFCAAFSNATDAVSAATTIQSLLEREDWTDVAEIRVRIGLHSGEAVERDRDYFGPALNRCARLMGIGHGQQILLSAATRELVRDDLPEGAVLKDLGDHRLRDLARSERVYQLNAAGLRHSFPPLRSLETFATNLPIRRTRFVGREDQLTETRRLLEHGRIVTLTGAGGSGKTRLALQAAADLLDAYRDGVWWVELAPIEDPDLVPHTAASALGLRKQPECPIEDTLAHYLRDKRMLLVLDNCEHVIDATARLVESILTRCPDVTVLATSREKLGVEGELAWVVPTLSAPGVDDAGDYDLERLTQYEAVELFVDRALAVRPDFAVDNDNAPAVAEVCHRLDGIPLAIELAAARLAVLSPDEILTRLDRRFRLLTGGPRTALPRQQTLLATLEWSYDLMTSAEQMLLRRLSVFRGGWTIQAAEEVCAGESIDASDVLDLLTALAQKSMVVTADDGRGTRFGLLETVREFGWEKLQESGEADAVRERHATCFANVVVNAKGTLGERAQLLGAEHDNIRAVLGWSYDSGRTDVGLRLAGSPDLRDFWDNAGFYEEAYTTVTRLLQTPSSDESRADRAAALITANLMAGRRGDPETSRTLSEEALAAYEDLGDRLGVARSLMALGNCAMAAHDLERASRLHQESLAIFREEDNARGIASELRHLGIAERARGDQDRARDLFEESLVQAGRDWDNGWNRMACLSLLAEGAMYNEGDLTRARSLLEESLQVADEIGYQMSTDFQVFDLGVVAMYLAEYDVANGHFEVCLAGARRHGSRPGERMALRFLGIVAQFRGDHSTARERLAEGLALDRDAGDVSQQPYSLTFLGLAARGLGDPGVASEHLEEALQLAEAASMLWILGWAHSARGVLATDRGDLDEARRQLATGIGELETWVDPYGLAQARVWLADVALADGNVQEASDLLEKSAASSLKSGYRLLVSRALDGWSALASLEEEHARALRLAGAAAAIRTIIGAHRAPIDRERLQDRTAASVHALGDEEAARLISEGDSLSLEDAVAYALNEASSDDLDVG